MARWAAAAALLSLACACSAPTVVPTGSPPPVSTPRVTAEPTPSALFEHPTGALDVVLRMRRSGGFLYPGTTIDEAPTFTLYGDGGVIYTVEEPGPNGAIRRALHQAHLNEEQIGALLENALGPGGLALARERYADVPLADATTTNFEIDAGGVRKTVAVYALGEFEEPGPDAEAREAFEALADALRNFGAEVEAGNAVGLGPFEPEAYRVAIFPDAGGDLAPSADWPWTDLEPSDFTRDNSGFGHLVVTPAQGEIVAALPVGDLGDPVVVGSDEITYVLRARPLLPDELPEELP
jgi:hypothetical protein